MEQRETVSVEFTVGIGEGKFTAVAVVPAGQTNLTQILPVLQALDNSLIEGVAAQLNAGGHRISCKAGCGACCRQMVPLSIFEAEALSAWIETLPEAQRRNWPGVSSRLAQARLCRPHRPHGKRGLLAETESARKLALDYLYQRIPCPFLEDESCSIHPIRPLICREYLVTSPPEHCYDPATLKAEPVHLRSIFPAFSPPSGRRSKGTRGVGFRCCFFCLDGGRRPPRRSGLGAGPQVLYEFVKRIGVAQCPPRAADA